LTKTLVERRSHPRHALAVEIETSSEQQPGHLARMTTHDLSMGGLYCSSTADFPEMTRLAVRLMLPEPLEVEAVVVRRRALPSLGAPRFELALYFPWLSPDQRNRLGRFLES